MTFENHASKLIAFLAEWGRGAHKLGVNGGLPVLGVS